MNYCNYRKIAHCRGVVCHFIAHAVRNVCKNSYAQIKKMCAEY